MQGAVDRNMEFDSRHSYASSSDEEDEISEGEPDEDIETRMPQETESSLRQSGRLMADEIEAIKRETDALKQEVEELRDHIRVVPALKEHVNKVTKDRDALISEAEHKAAIKEKIKKERDTLRHEIEKLRSQCEENGQLEDQLNALIQTCKDITEERDNLLLKAQIKTADKNTLNKVTNALKLETQHLFNQREASALLEDQLNVARKQYDEIAKERDSFKLRYRRSKEDYDAMRKITESLKAETENLRAQLNDHASLKEELDAQILECDGIANERDSSKLRYLRSESNNRAMREATEALKHEAEEIRTQLKNSAVLQRQLHSARQQCKKIKEDRDAYELRAQRIGDSRDDIKIERDALKVESEDLRAKIKHTDLLEKQIKAVRLQCDNIKRETDIYKLKFDRQEGIQAL
jgi:chromosome segregation ATPase